MATRRKPVKAPPGAPQHDHSVLVLQGGGALGAYQAGVYEGMAEQGFAPDWVTGVSIGAINAALISGNPPAKRVARLREFWELVSSGVPLVTPAFLDPMRMAFNRISASATMAFGVPGFFTPRVPPPFLQPDGTPEALSVYDTAPLRDTLRRLVDFDLINEKNDAKVRLSVGVSNVHSGNSEYFDNRDRIIGPEHIMASGALPPGFPPVEVDGSYYWDGGIVSNSPLWYVLDDSPQHQRADRPGRSVQCQRRAADHARPGARARQGHPVFEQDAIQHQSSEGDRGLRVALGRLLAKVPAKMHRDVDYELLAPFAQYKRNITIMHLINRRLDQASSAKDYEFSRGTMQMHWQTGLEDVRRTCAHPNWLNATEVVDGVRTFDLAE